MRARPTLGVPATGRDCSALSGNVLAAQYAAPQSLLSANHVCFIALAYQLALSTSWFTVHAQHE
jgi:hypothetical protein